MPFWHLWPLTSWPPNLMVSVLPQHTPTLRVWCKFFYQFSSYIVHNKRTNKTDRQTCRPNRAKQIHNPRGGGKNHCSLFNTCIHFALFSVHSLIWLKPFPFHSLSTDSSEVISIIWKLLMNIQYGKWALRSIIDRFRNKNGETQVMSDHGQGASRVGFNSKWHWKLEFR